MDDDSLVSLQTRVKEAQQLVNWSRSRPTSAPDEYRIAQERLTRCLMELFEANEVDVPEEHADQMKWTQAEIEQAERDNLRFVEQFLQRRCASLSEPSLPTNAVVPPPRAACLEISESADSAFRTKL